MYSYAQTQARIEAGRPVRLTNPGATAINVLLDPSTTRWLQFPADGGTVDLGASLTAPRILECPELMSYIAAGTLVATAGVERIVDGKLSHGGLAIYCEYAELVRSDISFHEGATAADPDEIRTVAGDFLDHFLAMDWLDIESDSTTTNETQVEILSVTADVIEVPNGSLTTEDAATAGEVTLKLWNRGVGLYGTGSCRGLHVRADSRIQISEGTRPDLWGHVVGGAEPTYLPWGAVEGVWINFRDGTAGDIVSIHEDGQVIT